ncbi:MULTISPECIES: trypsin-like peptidase domain-containing protein [unclassified Rhizobium]|uniref:trypsin-like peptidase domain-containing protein n=1 Tax=unclassified Rhizobium TaxID=2613769 RepID=UPI001621C2C9|nr:MULTISPECIES: trypsin-like peptidase domain-containing protein [unclassified Rhizobium]MBB3387131.1 serine protease Do/serine protease DegQ [Rhizobium sp. BK098]MBB3618829.1 serine protease Do/serine protease DegQ [Rhizobium sp. BK609]MBB3684492.1 serine protease Do/serine protease DegQ [Rhizobium sp. BK612]
MSGFLATQAWALSAFISDLQNFRSRCLVAAILPVLVFFPVSHQATATPLQPSLAPMLQMVMPSVVSITVRSEQTPSGDGLLIVPQEERSKSASREAAPVMHISQAVAAGVIVDAGNGYILTNNHVIENAVDINVMLADGSTYDSTVVGADRETDIAIIQIKAPGLIAAHLGDSAKLRVGDYVAAIGNPFGLGQTVTFGIVSALGRAELGVEGDQDIIQTDASLNPGNSGGALVNLDGELVGINSAIIAPSGSNIGIGFAIPSNTARGIMQQLIAHGEIRRGRLGVLVQDNNADFEKALGVNMSTGALVNDVISGSAGAAAGIKPGDVIIAVNDSPIKNAGELHARISSYLPKTLVKLSLLRPTGKVDLDATLSATLPEDQLPTPAEIEGRGLLESGTLDKLGSDFDAYGKVEGALVSALNDGSKAAAAGLTPGDVIISVNQQPTPTPQMVAELAQKQKTLVLLGIFRDGHRRFLIVK